MKYLVILLIRGYQVIPLNSHKMCRFTPTCSEYMIGCLEEFGLFKGLYLGIKRLLKCL